MRLLLEPNFLRFNASPLDWMSTSKGNSGIQWRCGVRVWTIGALKKHLSIVFFWSSFCFCQCSPKIFSAILYFWRIFCIAHFCVSLCIFYAFSFQKNILFFFFKTFFSKNFLTTKPRGRLRAQKGKKITYNNLFKCVQCWLVFCVFSLNKRLSDRWRLSKIGTSKTAWKKYS